MHVRRRSRSEKEAGPNDGGRKTDFTIQGRKTPVPRLGGGGSGPGRWRQNPSREHPQCPKGVEIGGKYIQRDCGKVGAQDEASEKPDKGVL